MAPLTNGAPGDIVPVEEPPTWAAPLIAAIKLGGPPRGQSPGGSDRKPGSRSPSPRTRHRSTPTGGFGPAGKFVFRGGCHHCNNKGHKRQDCPQFLAIKAKNNGKLPERYKDAREIAHEKWRSNKKARVANKDEKAENVRALASHRG